MRSLQVEAIVKYKWVVISVRGEGTKEGYSDLTKALVVDTIK